MLRRSNSNKQLNSTSGQEVVEWLRQTDSFSKFALDLAFHSQADTYLVGGAVRDYFFGVRPQDVDFVIPNDDDALTEVLEARADSFRTNRHGNRRYFFGDRSLDVIRPNCFYKPFATAESAVRYFDLSINALAIRLADSTLFAPWHGMSDIAARQVRTTGARWTESTDFEGAHLLMRLLRYARRYGLRLVDPESVRSNLPKLERASWDEVRRYHSVPRDAARRLLEELIGASESQAARDGLPRARLAI